MLHHRRVCFALIASLWLLGTSPQGVMAQDKGAAQDAGKAKEVEGEAVESKTLEVVVEEKPLAKPKYLNLRYDEDFSYLDGPEDSYVPDFFDPVKNIHLGEDWRLTLGGEFRFRMESETNKGFGATEPANDTFTLFRWMVHADLKYKKLFRVFAQGILAHDEDRHLPFRGIDENIIDLQQLFIDLRVLGEDTPLTLRVGRQDLQYGKQRLVSPLDWANTRRRFDGVKLFWKEGDWAVDAWWVKPVVVQRRQSDRVNEDFDFYGLYVTFKGIPRHGVDFYFLGVDDRANRRNPNGKRGDKSVYTLGGRFWGKTACFDYETELAGQWGHWAGDTIQAWSWTLNVGYTMEFLPFKPRIGAGWDMATGDDDPFDGKVQTFDQLFPLGHAYLGYLDLIGRQNVNAVNVNLSAWLVPKKLKSALAYHTFWQNQNEDAIYNAGGGAGRRDVTGKSGREIGHELDLTFVWKMCPHSDMLLGYSHFWDSDVIRNTGPSEDADLVYLQYRFRF